jgi:hypothetical protein
MSLDGLPMSSEFEFALKIAYKAITIRNISYSIMVTAKIMLLFSIINNNKHSVTHQPNHKSFCYYLGMYFSQTIKRSQEQTYRISHVVLKNSEYSTFYMFILAESFNNLATASLF